MSSFGPKQALAQKLQQKLSPQQIQLMKLLQIPTALLDQRIQEELEINPALEEGGEADDFQDFGLERDGQFEESDQSAEADSLGADAAGDDLYEQEEAVAARDDDFELDDYLVDFIEDDPSTYKTRGDDSDRSAEDEKAVPMASENSFHEYLEQQLGMLELSDDRERAVAQQIIGSIDDDGYLRRDIAAMVDDLVFGQNVQSTEQEILHILEQIQSFDPPGTGARDLQECLLLQLRHKMQVESPDLAFDSRVALTLATKIIEDYFDEFTKKHFIKLCRQLVVEEEELKAAIDEILKLNPKPASAFNSKNDRVTNYIVPDFIVNNRDGELELTLNARNAPELRINDQYREMLKSYHEGKSARRMNRSEKEAVLFIKQKIDSAKWFIDAILQRQQTMMLTMGSIMDHQKEYFKTGDEKRIRPMILKDIADTTGLDISTVSRVANSKYVQTEFGTRRLKDFFSESMQTQEGEEVSTLEVKKILSELVQEEHKKRPLSDEKLKSMLMAKGYNIARRTIAKYREQLNIPVARLRKEL
jgi:RNA polymerase sigma-54 factor